MINFRFQLSWPIKRSEQVDIYFKEWDLTKYKQSSLQISKFGYDYKIFEIDVDWRPRGQCHAGLRLDFSLFNYSFLFALEDKRHWDYDNHKWKQLGEM